MQRLIQFAFAVVLPTSAVFGQVNGRDHSDRVRDRGADELLLAGKQWDLLGEGYHLTADSTVDKAGNVYFTDEPRNRILRIDPGGHITTWKEDTNNAHGLALGPDGLMYVGQHERKRIVTLSGDEPESVITEGVQSHHLTVTARSHVYFTVPPTHKVWLIDATGRRRVVHDGLKWPRAVRASPDESALVVSDSAAGVVWSFRIRADGSLFNQRPFCRLEADGKTSEADAGGMAFDSEGFLYVATNTGVQVCSPQGRVTAVIDTPGEVASAVFFGGTGQQWLYVTDGSRIWRRPARRRGTALWSVKATQTRR